jgi:hypothetical protein
MIFFDHRSHVIIPSVSMTRTSDRLWADGVRAENQASVQMTDDRFREQMPIRNSVVGPWGF